MTTKTPLFLLALTTSLSACAAGSMEIPAELATVERLPVEGRSGWSASQRAAFGPWEATDVDRSWTKGSGWRIGVGPIGGGSDRAAQEYAFRFLEDGSEVGRVECAAVGSRNTGTSRIVDIDLSSREALECRQEGETAEGEPLWEMVVEAVRDGHLEGFLRFGPDRYVVSSSGTGGKFMPVSRHGFEIRNRSNEVVAAVETVGDGAVILSPELTGTTRTRLAAAAAALLLYEPVQGE